MDVYEDVSECPACLSTDWDFIYNDICECFDCGYHFKNEQPDDELDSPSNCP